MIRSERGSTSFLLVAMVLPLVFLLFSLSLDLERYFTESSRIQKALDDTVLYAQKFLPQVGLAEQSARSYLARFEGIANSTSLQVTAERVRLSTQKEHFLTFPQALGMHLGLPLKISSEAWSAPFDLLIGVDSGSYLAPRPQLGVSPWGDEQEWSSADFFRNFLPRYQEGELIDPRLITQQCFNPVFSKLKRAAIRAYSQLSASALNSVGIEVFPASIGSVWEVRELVPGGQRSEGMGEANFDQISRSSHAQDSWCAAASEQEISNSEYLFPQRSGSLPSAWYPESDPQRPSSMVQSGSWEFDSAYQPWLEARQAIWSRAVQSDTSEISKVLASVRDRVIGSGPNQGRKSLSQRGTKSALLLMGDLPWQAGSRFPAAIVQDTMRLELERTKEALDAYQMRLRIYLVIPLHQNLPADTSEQISHLQSFISETVRGMGAPQSLDFKVIAGSNLDSLYGGVVSQLLLERQTGVLAK